MLGELNNNFGYKPNKWNIPYSDLFFAVVHAYILPNSSVQQQLSHLMENAPGDAVSGFQQEKRDSFITDIYINIANYLDRYDWDKRFMVLPLEECSKDIVLSLLDSADSPFGAIRTTVQQCIGTLDHVEGAYRPFIEAISPSGEASAVFSGIKKEFVRFLSTLNTEKQSAPETLTTDLAALVTQTLTLVTMIVRQYHAALQKAAAEDTTEKITAERNEPCPCGSGKKYKKCCGKAN